MSRCTEDMKIWLFDLVHGNLSDDAVVSGFIKYYVLFDMVVGNVVQDIMYHTSYGSAGAAKARELLFRVLSGVADSK